MKLFLTAFALVLIIEGLPYFINPNGMKNMAKFVMELNPSTLRIAGFSMMIIGLFILYAYHYAN
jgi:hypothetical protein